VSKRLASFILAYGVLGGLIAPAGLVAQDQPADPATTTTTAPAETPPTETQAAEPPPPAPQPAATTPAPAAPQPAPAPPAPAADPAPVAVAAGPGTVTMKDIAFSPASVTVNVGDTVTWRNADEVTHNVTANDGSFATGSINRGASGSHTFAKAGSFGYQCTIHPGMNGAVKVVAAASGGGSQGGSSGGGSSSHSSGSGSSSSGSSTTSGSSASLPATGVDAAGLALWGLGFLLIGLFARRRTT
jgi:plastocyanin